MTEEEKPAPQPEPRPPLPNVVGERPPHPGFEGATALLAPVYRAESVSKKHPPRDAFFVTRDKSGVLTLCVKDGSKLVCKPLIAGAR